MLPSAGSPNPAEGISIHPFAGCNMPPNAFGRKHFLTGGGGLNSRQTMTMIIVNLFEPADSLEVAFMSQADTSHVSPSAPQSIPGAIIDIVVTVVRAFMGSLLGISTAAFFGVFGLVAFAAFRSTSPSRPSPSR
jgi:hypothetical protein